jgi:hypothetical protein
MVKSSEYDRATLVPAQGELRTAPAVTAERPAAQELRPPERGQMADAIRILGLKPRNIAARAARGHFSGAFKDGGVWTFDLAKLRAYVANKEYEQCQQAAQKRRPVRSGAVARSTVVRALRADSSHGRYKQITQNLRRNAAKQAKIAS